ncbi:hypothetical protein ACFPGR_05330 [Paeniglutamicibacter kerguelensis]
MVRNPGHHPCCHQLEDLRQACRCIRARAAREVQRERRRSFFGGWHGRHRANHPW